MLAAVAVQMNGSAWRFERLHCGFSSTQKTRALCGERRSTPTTSRNFFTNSVSRLSSNVSTRCGCRPRLGLDPGTRVPPERPEDHLAVIVTCPQIRCTDHESPPVLRGPAFSDHYEGKSAAGSSLIRSTSSPALCLAIVPTLPFHSMRDGGAGRPVFSEPEDVQGLVQNENR